MRKVMRFQDNRGYWDRRWSEAGTDAPTFADLGIYPIRYAEMVKPQPGGSIAELGCGLGRLVRHYHSQGFDVVGVERSVVAVERVRSADPDLQVRVGDVMHLDLADNRFDTLLAFGLYHNIETGMEEALRESLRILKLGGRFAISMRPDNLEMRLNEVYWRRRWKSEHRGESTPRECFHKWLVGEGEFKHLLESLGARVDGIHRARNMSILWRLPGLRASTGEGESENRSRGYRLNVVGRVMDAALRTTFPASFCNVLVYTGTKLGRSA